MQTKESQPQGKQKMLETRFTKFPALSVDPRVGISLSYTDSEIPTLWWTENAGNKVYQVSGIICWPEGWDFLACIADQCLIIFLTYDIKNYYLSFVISFIFDIYVA